jgi:hypothetical protein
VRVLNRCVRPAAHQEIGVLLLPSLTIHLGNMYPVKAQASRFNPTAQPE